METWVKFISDERVDVAPTNKGAVSNYNLSAALMSADGYKPLVVVEEASAGKPRVKYRDADDRVEQYAVALTDAEKNEAVRAAREARFIAEADTLKMDYDEAFARYGVEDERTAAAKAAWLAKKDEIREALPYVDVVDTADAAAESAESDADVPEEAPEETAGDGDD